MTTELENPSPRKRLVDRIVYGIVGAVAVGFFVVLAIQLF